MTQVRKARNFARRRRLLTAAILALTIGLVGTLTAAAAITGKASPSKAGSASNSLLAAATTVNGDASCGYSGTTQFTESTVMRWAQVNGTGLAATFSAYANDENSTLLGVNTATPNTSSPQHATNASGGDTTQHDALGRPYYPALYITKVGSSGTWTKPGDAIPQAAGDWQQGGTPRNLSAGAAFIDDVFGTWVVGTQTVNPSAAPGQVGLLANPPALSTATNNTSLTLQAPLTKTIYGADAIVVAGGGKTQTFKAAGTAGTVDAAPGATTISIVAAKATIAFPNGSTVSDTTAQTGNYARQATLPAKNDWNLGAGHDDPVGVPGAATPAAAFTSFGDEGYGTEFRWNVNELTDNTGAALETGTFYKIQVIEHDGDQNKGGDSGEFCTLIKIPGPPPLDTDPTGGTDPNAISGNSHIKQWKGTLIKDTAFVHAKAGFGNPTGTVTFKLYFDAGNAPTTCANATDAPPGVLVHTFSDVALNATNDPSVATSGTYDTAQNGLGTYYWQDTFTPGGSNASSYTTTTEACGTETDQMYDARVRLTPHTAINVVGNDHVLHAFTETIGAGDASWSAVSGALVTGALTTPTSAHFVPNTVAGSKCTTASGQSNPSGTYCNLTINDDTVETVLINASSTFTATGVTGGVNGDDSITRSTDNSASCASDNATGETCEAIKHYINPKTELTVSDKITGLGADASGTVSYTGWIDDSTCGSNDPAVKKDLGGGSFDLGGTPPVSIPASQTITVGVGHTVYFEAHYVGNEGTVTTQCTAESATSN